MCRLAEELEALSHRSDDYLAAIGLNRQSLESLKKLIVYEKETRAPAGGTDRSYSGPVAVEAGRTSQAKGH